MNANNDQKPALLTPGAEVGIIREIWDFLRVRKKFWLAPIIITLMLLGLLILFAGSAGVVSPFVYMM
jgi:hypothetical protein